LIVKSTCKHTFKGTEQALKQAQIESTQLQKSQGRTYKHLLTTIRKRQQFQNLTSSQLVKIDLQGNEKLFGSVEMVEHFAVSPDGNYLLVESLPEKLSPYIPYKKWGRQYQIVDLNHGNSIYQLPDLANKINLAKAKDSVPLGARGVHWLPFKAATIAWVEPTNNGVLSQQSAVNDIIYELASPFNKDKTVLLKVNWRYYDSIYTERFMRTPAENPSGYDDNSPINHTDKLKGNLLLCHGTADDNVHIQNVYEFAERLVQSNKQFEMQIYTNRNHSIYGGVTRLHLYNRFNKFLKDNL